MDPRGLADPLEAERTRAEVKRRLFGGPEEPLRVGRFVVRERIGQGGMGAVYAARDPELERDVALKVLHGGGAHDTLLAEAKALARLRHPNVVSVYEIGSFSGHTFVAMERVDGPSLRAWLRERERSWRDVVAIFVSAGRGLAAAHAAGLVHRDFKPDNVVIDAAGQARVVDFGLAREMDDEAEESAPSAPSPPDGPASETAPAHARTRIAGTLAYMAPELFEGRPATAATDQFAFSVSLYEALFGRHPFGEAAEMAAAVREHAPAEPPPNDVPRAVRAAVLRGLEKRPEDRHASLEALLDLLPQGPRQQRALVAAMAVAAALVVSAVVIGVPVRRGAPLCEAGDARVAGVWNPAARGSMRAAFEATKAPFAADAAATVERGLDAYARDWAAMYKDSCEATHVRGDQSRELLDLRTLCLTRRHEALRATVRALSSLDARGLRRSVTLVEQLPPVSACGDVEALRSTTPPPEDPAARAKLAELEVSLETVRVAFNAGRLAEAAEDVRPLVDEARALDHKPFLSEALLHAGDIALQKGDHEGAEAGLSEAAKAAQASGHTRIVANAAVRLVGVTGIRRQQYDKAKVWVDLAEASVERLNDPALRALLDDRVGAMLARQGKIDEALRRMERAVSATEATGATDTSTFAGYLNDWANVLDMAGRYDEALKTFSRALALKERVLGPMHPEVAGTLNNLAIVLERKSRYEEARAAYQRALDIAEALGGTDGMDNYLTNLGGVLRALGRAEEGLEKQKRALAMREAKFPANHPAIASSWNNLGAAFFHAKRYDDALAAFEKSLAMNRAAYGEEHPEVASQTGNIGEVHEARKDLAKALDCFTRAAAMIERILGPAHEDLGSWLAAQGRAELSLGKRDIAKKHLERAVEILEKAGGSVENLATARFDLARAIWATGGDEARARDLAEQAKKTLSEAAMKGRLPEVAAWLDAHAAAAARP